MELAVEKRTILGKKLKNVRKDWVVPGIVYGKYIDAPVNLNFNKQEFLKIYKKTGQSMPITIKGDGVEQLVLVHDFQKDPVSDALLHVDFITLKKGEKVQTSVSIILTGEAPIEKLGEGQVQLVKNELLIEAMPKDLPHNISVDISSLETTHDSIFVKDLVLDKGVEIVDDLDQPIVVVMSMSGTSEEDESTETEESAAGVEEVKEEKTEEDKKED